MSYLGAEPAERLQAARDAARHPDAHNHHQRAEHNKLRLRRDLDDLRHTEQEECAQQRTPDRVLAADDDIDEQQQ